MKTDIFTTELRDINQKISNNLEAEVGSKF
jgi:hypothetical protein